MKIKKTVKFDKSITDADKDAFMKEFDKLVDRIYSEGPLTNDEVYALLSEVIELGKRYGNPEFKITVHHD